MYSSQSQDSYNLFLTSAITDGIKLWDLRTSRWGPVIYFSFYWLHWVTTYESKAPTKISKRSNMPDRN